MHAHPDPRRLAAAALGALALTLMTLVLLAGLASVDLGLGGDGGSASAPAAPSVVERPAWLDDPLASPLDELRALPPVRPAP